MISSSIIALFSSHSFLFDFVNFSFYFGLVFIIIGGFLFLTQRGFFNITIYALRKLGRSKDKKVESLIENDDEEDPKEALYRTYSFAWTYPAIITGLVLWFFSTVISFTVLV
ncbi:DUF3899 domain-containing protein [Bacillus manliponensis]|uniref:DUF3899 domain-containing protein n=1 Tax=Bacillus manliponensis TaxID=574376 RepID=UPI003518A0D1